MISVSVRALSVRRNLLKPPRKAKEPELLKAFDKAPRRFQAAYNIISLAAIVIFGIVVSRKYVWAVGIALGVIADPVKRRLQTENTKNC